MKNKTKLMLEAEERIGQNIEQALPQLVTELGVAETGRRLGVSTATVNYWMLKFGIQLQRVAVTPKDQVIVKRTA